MTEYQPKPIDTDQIELPTEIDALTEKLAENAHDIWAAGRMKEGWTYGEKRDNVQKKHPCLIPYADLPESEKEYDRNTSMETANELSQNWNIRTVAVLPMPKELFLNTIKDKERFERILDEVYMQYSLPLVDPNCEAQIAEVQNPETEIYRQHQYKRLARFLALHSHVLFAFWDGIDINKMGGVSNIIHFKLEGNLENLNRIDSLTYTSIGPIVHFLFSRRDASKKER